MSRVRNHLLTGCLALVALVGCTLPVAQVAAPARNATVGPDASWMAPEAQTEDLLYVSDVDKVFVFSYPAGKLVGTLTGFYQAGALCVDASGDVFVPNENGVSIEEYAHGGTAPIAILWDYGQGPVACSVDPISGDLAVSDSNTESGGPGSIAIYHKARGWPRYIEGKGIELYWFCSYDNAGNLFYDYYIDAQRSHFMEIPKGTRKPREIGLNAYIRQMGAIQWDGQHITLGDANASTIYRLSISGSKGTAVGTSRLKGENNVGYAQYWIQGSNVIIPFEQFKSDVGFWKYPAGGNHFKVLANFGGDEVFGVTVSLASSPKP